MDRYIGGLDRITRVSESLARVREAPETMRPRFAVGLDDGRGVDVPDGLRTVAGAAAGFWLWKDHHWLGAAAGASLARNVPAMFSDDYRRAALCNLAQTMTAVGLSAASKKHPIWSFVAGWLFAGLLLEFGGFRK